MRFRIARQASVSCGAGTSYFRCAKGPFNGCCSTNPCDSGVCGDDSETNSETTIAKTSNRPTVTDSASFSASANSRSLAVTTSMSSLTSAASTESRLTSTTSESTATRQSATSKTANAVTSSTSQPSDPVQPPIGPIVGGVLGGLALLALLSALVRYYLERQSQTHIKIGREKKEVDKKRDKELLEAEAAVLEREKFLDAARLNARTGVKNVDLFVELGGYIHENNVAGRLDSKYHQQQSPLSSSSSAIPQLKNSIPTITHTPAPPSISSKVQENRMPLLPISEKDTPETTPRVGHTKAIPIEMPVDTKQATSDQQAVVDQNSIAASRTALHVDPPALSKGRKFNGSARISFTQSTDFSSSSSNTNSITNTASPVSPPPPKALAAPENVVMRGNLNGSRIGKARPGSVPKHVMSFMEYDTENDSTCSNGRSSFRMPGKAYLPGEQTRGDGPIESSWRK